MFRRRRIQDKVTSTEGVTIAAIVLIGLGMIVLGEGIQRDWISGVGLLLSLTMILLAMVWKFDPREVQ